MSCFRVSKEHLALLTIKLVEYKIVGSYPIVFNELARANNKSVNARYGERKHAVRLQKVFIDFASFSNGAIVKQIDCFCYQTCEYEGWRNSYSKHWLDDLKAKLQPMPNDMDKFNVDYNNAEWGI